MLQHESEGSIATHASLDGTTRRTFDRDGFVAIRGFFGAAEIAALARAIDDDRARVPEPAPSSFFYRRSPAVARYSLHAGLGALAAELLRVDGVRLVHDALFEKGPRESGTWHRDSDMWSISGPALTIWIPLQPTPADIGLDYVFGSHHHRDRRPLRRHQKALLPLRHAIASTDLAVGDLAIHHSGTLHRAARNRRTIRRRAFALHLFDADAVFLQPFNKYCHGHNANTGWDRLQPGESFPDSLAPLVYRRER